MSKTFDLYGTQLTLDSAQQLLTRIFDCTFEPRNSAYFGDYFLGQLGTETKFTLRQNLDPIDGEPVEFDYSNFPVILYVTTSKASVIQEIFESKQRDFHFLRQKETTMAA